MDPQVLHKLVEYILYLTPNGADGIHGDTNVIYNKVVVVPVHTSEPRYIHYKLCGCFPLTFPIFEIFRSMTGAGFLSFLLCR